MKKILLLILSVVLLGACSSEDNSNIGSGQTGNGKTYSADLLLATPKGDKPDINTRGLDAVNGQFTDVYPYDYIYLHSADSKTKEEGHQCIKIPLKDVVFCDGCKGIHLEMSINEEENTYTIGNGTDFITLNNDEKVYFSTIDDTYWKADVQDASPVTGSNVFYQTDGVNEELLRSADDYSKDKLISLLSEQEPDIPMSRHCTAFRVYFMFTNVVTDQIGSMSQDQWNEMLTSDYDGGQFYIKLYLGPNFAEEYNVYTDDVKDPNAWGFYVTNQQKYQPFESSFYVTSPGTAETIEDIISFTGFGYQTDAGNYLIAPLNTHLPATGFSIYAFVKFAPKGTVIDEDFLTSDEGAKWFQLQVPSMTLETNRVHYVILAVGAGNLEVFKPQEGTTTSATRAVNSEPEEIKVNSVVVKDFVE